MAKIKAVEPERIVSTSRHPETGALVDSGKLADQLKNSKQAEPETAADGKENN